MKAKFFTLPLVLIRQVDTFLNSSDSSHLATTANYFHALSEQAPLPLSQRKPLKKFLKHVVHGEHEQVREMLRHDIRLLVQRDKMTDCSGRAFASISGFEYVLWALDKHLWDDMLACLPRDEEGHLTKVGLGIVEELRNQYIKVKTKGVTYGLNEMTETESHYDFSIISVLQEHVNAQNEPGDKNCADIDKHWCKFVGGVQRLAPVHVVDEYCSDTPFLPVPQFVARPKPANGGVRRFYDFMSSVWESWFMVNSRLGVDFAIYKGGALGAVRRMDGSRGGALGAGADLAAMKALSNIRTLDFRVLEARLESLRVVEEQPRPVI